MKKLTFLINTTMEDHPVGSLSILQNLLDEFFFANEDVLEMDLELEAILC
tara:strand:- start:1523 stop:1672 length:150 start_codon:yes stop_codon:yes gene_type:complete